MKNKQNLLFCAQIGIALLAGFCLFSACENPLVSSADFITQNTAVVGLNTIPYTDDDTAATGADGVYCLPAGQLTLAIPLDNPDGLKLNAAKVEWTAVPDNVQSAVVSGNTVSFTLKSAADTRVSFKILSSGGRILLDKTGENSIDIANILFSTFLSGLSTNVSGGIQGDLSLQSVFDYAHSQVLTNTLTVNAVAEGPAAAIQVEGLNNDFSGIGDVSGDVILSPQVNNPIAITVTAPHGVNSRTYTLNVTADISLSADSTLKMLQIDGNGIDINTLSGDGTADDPFTYSTDRILSDNSASISIAAAATESQARIGWRNGDSVGFTDYTSLFNIDLIQGVNEIWLEITAQNNTDKMYYKIEVDVAPSHVSALQSLQIDDGENINLAVLSGTGTADDPFIIGTMCVLENNVSSLSVTASTADTMAAMSYRAGSSGTDFTYFNASGIQNFLNLSRSETASENVIWLKVTAQNETDETYYMIEITFIDSNVSTLKTLSINGDDIRGTLLSNGATGAVDEPFVHAASVMLSDNIAAVALAAAANDSKAAITYRVGGSGGFNTFNSSQSISLNPSDGEIWLKVTAQNGNETYYRIDMDIKLSSNSTLGSLSIDGGASINLSNLGGSGTEGAPYALINAVQKQLASGSASISITAAPSDSMASIGWRRGDTGSFSSHANPLEIINQSLTASDTEIWLEVTAQNTTNTTYYKIFIQYDASTISTLTTLTVDSGDIMSSLSGTGTLTDPFSYTTTGVLADNAASITVGAAATDANASIYRRIGNSGAFLNVFTDTYTASLSYGSNEIWLEVTAQNTAYKTYYLITVDVSKSAVSTLKTLKIYNADISLTGENKGGDGTNETTACTYEVTKMLENNAASISMEAFTNDSEAKIECKVNSGAYENFTNSQPINLTTGTGVDYVYLRVTAQDKSNKTYYKIEVTKIPSNVSTLSYFSFQTGGIGPTYTINNAVIDELDGDGTVSSPYTYTFEEIILNDSPNITTFVVTSDNKATIDYNVNELGEYSKIMNPGVNTIVLQVTAQDGESKTYYKIMINKRPGKPTTVNPPSAYGNLSITFDWTSVTGATEYQIFHTNDVFLTPTEYDLNIATDVTFDGVNATITTTAEGIRNVWVRAVTDDIVGEWSAKNVFYVGSAFTTDMLDATQAPAGSGGVRYIASGSYDITSTHNQTVTGNVTLIPLGDVTLQRIDGYVNEILNVADGATLNLNSSDAALAALGTLTIDGGEIAAQNAAIFVNGGICKIYSGVTIQNNVNSNAIKAQGWGGGIRITKGSVELNGGNIRNNTAYSGGGVALDTDTDEGEVSFTFIDGSINNNKLIDEFGSGGGIRARGYTPPAGFTATLNFIGGIMKDNQNGLNDISNAYFANASTIITIPIKTIFE